MNVRYPFCELCGAETFDLKRLGSCLLCYTCRRSILRTASTCYPAEEPSIAADRVIKHLFRSSSGESSITEVS
ncbi:MAG: hypothetical protein KatS3mg015_2461 [Fimbriimonadales bacterium]|nr:MAG: hypothetical protein KatS3mg015_2461 [Fimbriimonadales bacterium]